MNPPTTAPNAKKILVIDDNKVVLTAMSLLLRAKGYRVLTPAYPGLAPGTAVVVTESTDGCRISSGRGAMPMRSIAMSAVTPWP